MRNDLASVRDLQLLRKIRLVTLDLDGTIIGTDGTISERTKEAVRRVQEVGISVAIATGRPWFGAHTIAADLNVSCPSLFYAGSLILNPATGDVHYESVIEPSLVLEVVQAARVRGIYCELYTRDGYYVENDTDYRAIHAEYLKTAAQLAPLGVIAESHQILKLGFVARGMTEELSLKALFSAFPHLSSTSASGAGHPGIVFGNFTSNSASRQAGFSSLCRLASCAPEEVASFGDGESDIPFLTLAGLGIAMANAPLVVQNAADFVTTSVDEDGVAAVLELIEQSVQQGPS